MQYNRLGHSDLTVSRICIGTMTFGDRVDQAEAARCCDLALERGVNFSQVLQDALKKNLGLAR